MITVRLIGGLGNQMFQYAYGRRLSLKKNEKLKLDLTFLLSRIPRKNFTFRDYELDIFNIKPNFTFLSKVALYFKDYVFILQIIINKISIFFLKDSVFDEVKDSVDLEKRALKTTNNIYLSGLFDREEHFLDIKQIIIDDFSFKKDLEGSNRELADNIKSVNSVSLHIRRGDQVELGYTICESDYYQKAIDYIYKSTKNPVFYIFSDEPYWVKDNLKISTEYYVVDNNKGCDSYIDMRLMSLCKHNIIANSTFSWWGAWLNANDDKIVIAPKEYSDSRKGAIPINWLKIE